MPDGSPAAPAVVAEGLSKTFRIPRERMHTLKERALHPLRRVGEDELRAVSDVSFTVEQGEFFGIVGRNGSGKSTLLKCLAGIYRLDSGQIRVDGRMATFIELGVGFNPDLAALDNVVLNSVMLGVPQREARRRFEEIIAFAELEEFVDLKLKNYSSGMMVRLAFATAIQADADILLIDEVLAVGDAAFQQKCFDVFIRMKEEGRTILFVTHDMGSVTRFCDRAMLLERGKAVVIDEPDRVAQSYLHVNFSQEGPDPDAEESGVHWRSGPTEIKEVWTEDELGSRRDEFVSSEPCTLRARIAFHEDVADPGFNVVWLNEKGESVFAVSTVNDARNGGRFAAGEEAVVAVSFVPSLAPARYSVSVNISRRGSGLELIERWDRAIKMMVHNPRAGGGLVDLPYELTVERAPAREATAS